MRPKKQYKDDLEEAIAERDRLLRDMDFERNHTNLPPEFLNYAIALQYGGLLYCINRRIRRLKLERERYMRFNINPDGTGCVEFNDKERGGLTEGVTEG